MKTLMLAAAAAVSLGFATASAMPPADTMHDTMVRQDDSAAQREMAAQRQQAGNAAWLRYVNPTFSGG